MKKIFLVVPVLLLIFISIGCKDDSTSSTQKNVIISYSKQESNDTLVLTFKYQDTAYTFRDSAGLSQFDSIAKVIYEITPSNGSGDFNLYNSFDSIMFAKHFTGYVGNTVYLTAIPKKYLFSIVNFSGIGTIKVVK